MPLPTRARRTAALLSGCAVVGALALVPRAGPGRLRRRRVRGDGRRRVGRPLGPGPRGERRARRAGRQRREGRGQDRAERLAAARSASGVYRLTATFGQCSGLWSHCHTGLDFAAPEGTPIKALANGVVSETGWAGAYGNRTVITLDDGTDLWYCHQSQFAVKEGQPVVGGQTIGYVGSTGNSTGPHLHLEVRPGGGDAVDPERALAVRGTAP